MSLANDQFKKALQEAIQEELREGRLPDLKAIENQVLLRFNRERAGKSQYVPSLIPERSISDPKLINENLKKIIDDVSFAFNYIQEQREKINKMLSATQERTETTLGRVKKLSRELELISLMLPIQKGLKNGSEVIAIPNPFGKTYLETFSSGNALDPERTTAQIDPRSNSATLGYSRNKPSKVKIQGMSLDFGPHSAVQVPAAPLSNLLDDSLNTEWRHEVTGSGRISLVLEFWLQQARSLNKVEIQNNSPQATQFQLFAYFDAQGTNEFAIGEPVWVSDTHSWQLPASPFKGFRLKMTKEFADLQGDKYYFGLKNLEVLEETFSDTSDIVTLPFNVPRFDYLTFAYDADIPPNTNITAYVADKASLDVIGEGAWKEVKRFDPHNPNQEAIFNWQEGENRKTIPLVARLQLSRNNIEATPVINWFAVMTSSNS